MRAALDRARLGAAREVRFSADGVVAVGPLGGTFPLTRGGAPAPVPLDDVRKALSSYSLRSRSGSRGSDMEREFGESGTWTLAKSPEGTVALRAKKPGAICLEQLFSLRSDADAEALARLRHAYRLGDVDLAVAVEGEARARDVAAAIAAERAILGLPVRLSLPPDERVYGYGLRDPEPEAAPFDPPAGGPPWHVELDPKSDAAEILLTSDPGFLGEGRVRVSSVRDPWRLRAAADRVAVLERPSALLVVSLEKSRPVARVLLSDSLRALTSPDPGFGNAPGTSTRDAPRPAGSRARPRRGRGTRRRRRSRRPSSRGRRRGAWSRGSRCSSTDRWPSRPTAGTPSPSRPSSTRPDGVPTILMGRSAGHGDGTVTCAQGDVTGAAGKAFRVVDVHDLTGIATLGGKPVAGLADHFRYDKDEADHPRSCGIDHAGLRRWLLGAWDEAQAEMARAGRNRAATYVKAQAIGTLADLSAKRDLFAGTFGVDLPPLGDAVALKAEARTAQDAAYARQRALEDRARALPRPAEAEDDGPAPRF